MDIIYYRSVVTFTDNNYSISDVFPHRTLNFVESNVIFYCSLIF